MTSLTKKPATPNQKKFFRVQTRRLAASFDASTRSITCTGARDIPAQSHVRLDVFFQKSPKAAGCQNVKNITMFRGTH